ncbi:MAG: class I SAM-dependent methyltransferase [Pseudomonadota bacterium]|uniref:class I SAM-dependent methyltransferase n=1 Tax=Phenylobacterium sp. TaxID=1871053 RepID=UPI002600B5D3|nr:class I SAM-dependent methyltransferase [Phenylobacterium sp.]MBT9472471.1 class I SAM-dependent methyltransferase [Phenylobacterium sp.]
MSDLHYADPRLVPLYDLLNGGDADHRFYEARIGAAPLKIVDLGCGTGVFAVRLARQGHTVTGVDPAAAMLDVARARPGGDLPTWVLGDAEALRGRFDVAVMTGHAFQCLLTDAAMLQTFDQVRARLDRGGRFMFETRNPKARAWDGWTPEASSQVLDLGGGNQVRLSHEVLALDGEQVRFQTRHRFMPGGDEVVSRSTLRFAPRAMIEQGLRAAGFGRVDWFGDWEGGALSAGSSEMIAVATAE